MALPAIEVTRTTQGLLVTVRGDFTVQFELKEEAAMELHKELEMQLYDSEVRTK